MHATSTEHAIRVCVVTNDEAVLKFHRVKNENGDFIFFMWIVLRKNLMTYSIEFFKIFCTKKTHDILKKILLKIIMKKFEWKTLKNSWVCHEIFFVKITIIA